MDYPDEDEEYELRYQEELEMLDEFPPSDPPAPAVHQKSNDHIVLPSPQLSQISFAHSDTSAAAGGGFVNRRLFGTPTGPQRGASTPLPAKQRMPAIEEIAPIEEQPGSSRAVGELQALGLRSKRRLVQDLFGDIDDLYNNETYEDPMAKKMRTEERRDQDAIEKILDTRRRLREASKSMRKDNLSQLQLLHDFKMRNLAYTVPQWPFLPLSRSDDQRIYVRFHSDEYETRALNDIRAVSNLCSVLGESKQQVWAGANEIVLRRTATTTESQEATTAVAPPPPASGRNEVDKLWVEKYKPRKYIDLLSAEMTNRSLLYWLKMWDKVVFGKEFKVKQEGENTGELNSFNKRTGKFESNGGWQKRKTKQALNTNVDDLGRPVQKVALLCGPPGLGKTTLAHIIARHAGYSVREVNASDDRSPEAFKMALENGTQMSSVLNEDRRPNCIILDEIDGAPRQSIEFLVKFVTDNVVSKVRGKGSGEKTQRNILKRPIICICNDVYDPALRTLKQIAFVVTFPPIDSARLAERLELLARQERLKTDFGSLIALAEKSGNDVRSCISTMQFFGAQKKPLTLQDVLNSNMGQKDRHQGLFDIWGAIFRVQRPKRQLETRSSGTVDEEKQVTMSDMSVGTRVRTVLDAVHSGGDYERLMQGVYENYLQQRMPDGKLNGVVEALKWFGFSDALHQQINQKQNYTVYPYLQYGFAAWHLLFASLSWPKITFPVRGFEVRQKTANQKNIFQALRKAITSGSVGMGQGSVVLVETVPLLKRILSPQLRSVAVQLLSSKEQYDLKHTVEIMVDLGITYTQVRSAEGPYLFQMEPDLDTLAQFPGCPGVTLTYFGRQLLAREVELERIRRATPKLHGPVRPMKSVASAKKIPNHLQTLQPKNLDQNANVNKTAKEGVSKDFFGRIQRKTTLALAEESKIDPIVKSVIWYRYKEGFNNAVRKDVHMNELL